MNTQSAMEKMHEMKLHGMLRAFREMGEPGGKKKSMTPDEMTVFLIQAEWDERQSRKLQRLIQEGRFRYQAGFEDIDYMFKRKLDKNMLMRLADGEWLKKGKNVIITGPTGIGKSFIASALGHQACLNDRRVLYFNCLKLFTHLKYAQADHTYLRELKKIQRADLLVLDDFGLKPLDDNDRLSLLELLEDRTGLKSTVVVTQIPVGKWHAMIGDSTIADAVCDRLVHSAFRFELDGDTMRKNDKLDKPEAKS
jgi:DNA replication protein DnaC